jgi:predicted nucleic acid-binding protein
VAPDRAKHQVFVDTSALYAILDRDDQNYLPSARIWDALVEGGVPMITTNYVVVETCALVQHRLGLDALRTFSEDMLPVIDVRWIVSQQHTAALESLLTANRRRLSLVDCASFLVMRTNDIRKAFAFDQHFSEQGFEIESA